MFGGSAVGGLHNDLWKFDVTTQYWTWIGGSNIPKSRGSYGTKNVPSPTNVPSGRRNAASWLDVDGNFWLFGGEGWGSGTENLTIALNDLWMFDVDNGIWTWVGGAHGPTVLDNTGVYGTVPSTANIPGARLGAAVTVDPSGAAWIFGGEGIGASAAGRGAMNDLWKFDPATRVWSWISGADTPIGLFRVQGELGVPSPANNPGERVGASLWADAIGNLWMFGGRGPENDMWRFDTASSVWTWMGGAAGGSGTAARQGIYQMPGTTSNYPAGREFPSTGKDSAGNFWLFGGTGIGPGPGNVGPLNDLWNFSPASNTWTWYSGTNEPCLPAHFGTLGVPDIYNVPGCRHSGALWTDPGGHIWLWSGSTDFGSSNFVANDIWTTNLP